MKAKTKNKALKRLIPAVAMLAMSATMLSTATYAWFTMNKEVKMTGLNMTATVGEGIEISLAGVDGSKNLTFTGFPDSKSYPADNDAEKGWKSNVIVGNYYESIGKIKPSSSADGAAFFDATDASEGGKVASTFKTITAASIDVNATDFVKERGQLDANTLTVGSSEIIGYYVDIPVHIRTSKSGDGEGAIYCKMAIDDADANNTKELYKAVRVAFIDNTGATVILGADDTYYGAGAVSAIDGSGVGSKTAVAKLKAGTANGVFDSASSDDYKNFTGIDSGLKIPYATGVGGYGHLDFTVRVWLEGESKFCFDANAGQSWNIDLAFSLGEFETTT